MSKLLVLFGEKEARILVLGLDNAGKTTILCARAIDAGDAVLSHWLNGCYMLFADRLQVGEVVSTIPSEYELCYFVLSAVTWQRWPAAIGFNVESVTYKNIKFQVWDLGGQTSIRPYWRCYYPNTQAIIYVVDSSDTDRVGTSREEFHAILQEEELKDALLLIYANKQAS